MNVAQLKSGVLGLSVLALLSVSRASGQSSQKPTRQILAIVGEGSGLPYPIRVSKFLKGVVVAKNAHDIPGEALGYRLSGQYEERIGYYERAQQLDECALTLYRKLKDPIGEAYSLLDLALVSDARGQTTKALKFCQQALRMGTNLGLPDCQARALGLMGLTFDKLGDKPRAKDSCLHALKILRKAKNPEVEATVLNGLAAIYSNAANPSKALEVYTQAIEVDKSISDPYMLANTLNGTGLAQIALMQLEDSRLNLLKALPLYKQLGDLNGQAAVATNLGNLYYQLNQPAKSLSYLQQGLSSYEKLGDDSSRAIVLGSIAAIYLWLDDPAKAMRYDKLALGIQRRTHNISAQIRTEYSIGLAYRELGQREKAISHLNETLALAKKSADRTVEALALSEIGATYSAVGKNSKAMKYFQLALPIQREAQNLRGEASTLEHLSIITATMAPDAGILYQKLAVNIFQVLRRNISQFDEATRHDYKESVAKAYRRLADLLATQGRIGEAEQVLRLLKDDEFYDFVRGSVTSIATKRAEYTLSEIAFDREYEALTTALAKDATDLRELQRATPPDPTKLKQLTNRLEEGEVRFQAFLDRVIDKSRALDVPANTIQRIQDSESISSTLAVLPEGTVAVYVLAGPDALRFFFFAPGVSVGRATNIKVAELNRKVFDFRQTLTDPRSDPRPEAKEFYNLLVKPIESLLKDSHAKRIMWSLDGQLRYIPMAALYDGSQFLIEKFDLSTFTPAGGSALLEREAKPNWNALVAGVSKAHDIIEADGKAAHFESLSGVPYEVDGVMNAIPNSKKLLDSEFTLDSFKAALSTHPNVVHLATHFSFHPGDEKNSYFITGDGKPFRVADARTLSTLSFQGVSLLTLSACETGLGGSDGSEVEGITAVLQKKGAESVISTLWPVSDASTAALMQEFYRLHETHPDWTKLHALQSAQIELLNGHLTPTSGLPRGSSASDQTTSSLRWPKSLPRFSHPYYWAPFVLVGNWK